MKNSHTFPQELKILSFKHPAEKNDGCATSPHPPPLINTVGGEGRGEGEDLYC